MTRAVSWNANRLFYSSGIVVKFQFVHVLSRRNLREINEPQWFQIKLRKKHIEFSEMLTS